MTTKSAISPVSVHTSAMTQPANRPTPDRSSAAPNASVPRRFKARDHSRTTANAVTAHCTMA
jgi:hypothetical protein